ncbi:hypothetical protein DFQ29_000718 [Apophysomyces sp. BC1021]|nr:hypothetical protein DFQ29_000718 [Apophysomyces sp. BC1021]
MMKTPSDPDAPESVITSPSSSGVVSFEPAATSSSPSVPVWLEPAVTSPSSFAPVSLENLSASSVVERVPNMRIETRSCREAFSLSPSPTSLPLLGQLEELDMGYLPLQSHYQSSVHCAQHVARISHRSQIATNISKANMTQNTTNAKFAAKKALKLP